MARRRLLLFVPLVLLLVAIGLIAYGQTRVPEPAFRGNLRELLPPAPAGWTMKEKRIAESPEMQKAVGEILNFDDGVFADYLGPAGERLSVYIAYWTPGRMSHRLVAGHTPDVCWVGNGWLKASSSDTEHALPDFPVGEARIFKANGTAEHVWFWHLVGAESMRYGTGYVPPWTAAITDLFRRGLNQREEQFFIRLSSNRELQPQLSEPVLPLIIEGLPWPTSSH